MTRATYKGWTIEYAEATQVGYRVLSGVPGKGRKITGYEVSHPEHRPQPKWCDDLDAAKAYVDTYMSEETDKEQP